MGEIGVRELRQRVSDVLRRVREQGESFDITYRGRVVARLMPAAEKGRRGAEVAAVWTEMDRLAEEIASFWQAGISAQEAVREQRREPQVVRSARQRVGQPAGARRRLSRGKPPMAGQAGGEGGACGGSVPPVGRSRGGHSPPHGTHRPGPAGRVSHSRSAQPEAGGRRCRAGLACRSPRRRAAPAGRRRHLHLPGPAPWAPGRHLGWRAAGERSAGRDGLQPPRSCCLSEPAASAGRARAIWRCQPCQLRASQWSSPTAPLASLDRSLIVAACPRRPNDLLKRPVLPGIDQEMGQPVGLHGMPLHQQGVDPVRAQGWPQRDEHPVVRRGPWAPSPQLGRCQASAGTLAATSATRTCPGSP